MTTETTDSMPTAPEPARTETQKQKEAFEFYYRLGRDRNMTEVSAKFGVTKRSVENWSVWFGWKERARALDDQANERAQQIVNETLGEVIERQKRILKFAVSQLIERLKSGEVKLAGSDLVKFLEHELELNGYHINRAQLNVFIDAKTQGVYNAIENVEQKKETLALLEGDFAKRVGDDAK